MELNGQLCGADLVDLLQMVGLGRKTGTLLLRNTDEWAALVIDEGRLARILSQKIYYEPFGVFLNKSGILDENLLVLQQVAEPRHRVGEIVNDYGLGEGLIEKAALAQAQSLMAQLLCWKVCNFSFHSDRLPVDRLPVEIQQIELGKPLEVMDLLLLAGQEVDESHQELFTEERAAAVSSLSAADLEKLIISLAHVDEAVLEGRETNARFRLSMVRSFMAELRACGSQQETLMLLLRAAGEIAGRGLLVQMKRNELYNLGYYKSAPVSEYKAQDVGDIKNMISVDPDCLDSSILGCARLAGQAVILNWSELSGNNEVNNWLLAQFGSQLPLQAHAFVIPTQIGANSLILYGDDSVWPVDFDQLAGLEIMLYQAARALESIQFEQFYSNIGNILPQSTQRFAE